MRWTANAAHRKWSYFVPLGLADELDPDVVPVLLGLLELLLAAAAAPRIWSGGLMSMRTASPSFVRA